MSELAVRRDTGDVIEAVITKGDLARLTPQEKTKYYAEVCRSVGLNPFTRPFEYISLSGKLVLYARREATDQLRRLNGISLEVVARDVSDGILTVHVRAQDKTGRVDEDFGAVSIKGLTGEALANQTMKAITKGKRRVTLSISGLGFLDESEIGDIPAHERAAPADTRAQLDAFAGEEPQVAEEQRSSFPASGGERLPLGADAYDPGTGEVLLHGEALEAHAREVAANGTEPLRELFRDLTQRQRDELGTAIGSPTTPGPLLMLARQADARSTESPAGIPPAAALKVGEGDFARADAAAPAGAPGEAAERPDALWLAEFAAMAPKPTGDDDAVDWRTYAEALQYMIGQATAADLQALEIAKNLHLRRLREEEPETYRAITQAIAARAKELVAQ